MRRAERLLGALLLLFAIYIGYESSLIESGEEFGMGPAFLPFWLSVGLGILAASLLARAVVLPASRFEPSFWPEWGGAARVALVAGCYLLALLVMKPLGMPISVGIISATTMPILGARNWKLVAVTVILAPLMVYVVFGRWLSVPLPMGVLENVLPLY